jgi:hypothetical protein
MIRSVMRCSEWILYPNWKRRRADVLAQISHLGDFRPGSITATQGRCGNPNCHCHKPGQPGHGPNLRLTYKVAGKTLTESFATPAAQRKPSGKWPSSAATES